MVFRKLFNFDRNSMSCHHIHHVCALIPSVQMCDQVILLMNFCHRGSKIINTFFTFVFVISLPLIPNCHLIHWISILICTSEIRLSQNPLRMFCSCPKKLLKCVVHCQLYKQRFRDSPAQPKQKKREKTTKTTKKKTKLFWIKY